MSNNGNIYTLRVWTDGEQPLVQLFDGDATDSPEQEFHLCDKDEDPRICASIALLLDLWYDKPGARDLLEKYGVTLSDDFADPRLLAKENT